MNIGVDGCPGGWLAALESPSSLIECRVYSRFDLLMNDLPQGSIAAVDIPIGLPEGGSRICDLMARQQLGPKRGSSIFPAPIRSLLDAADYRTACDIRERIDGKKISKQLWNIIPKIREVDDFLSRSAGVPPAGVHVVEASPELCFLCMADCVPVHPAKRTLEGRRLRMKLLENHFGILIRDVIDTARRQGGRIEDILDALACLWTARRIRNGSSRRLPEEAPLDRNGLKMAVYC